MAANKVLERGTPLQIAVPVALRYASYGAISGLPLLVGTLACIAQENDGDITRPPTDMISVDLEGAYLLPVLGVTSASSPLSGPSAVNPGDKIYASGGTTDSTTGVTYGITLTKDTGGTLFGTAISIYGSAGPLLPAGQTGTISVRLKGCQN